jgi:hypothetical protein
MFEVEYRKWREERTIPDTGGSQAESMATVRTMVDRGWVSASWFIQNQSNTAQYASHVLDGEVSEPTMQAIAEALKANKQQATDSFEVGGDRYTKVQGHPRTDQLALLCDGSDTTAMAWVSNEVVMYELDRLKDPWSPTKVQVNGKSLAAFVTSAVPPNDENNQAKVVRFRWDMGLYRVEFSTTRDELAAREMIANMKLVDVAELQQSRQSEGTLPSSTN